MTLRIYRWALNRRVITGPPWRLDDDLPDLAIDDARFADAVWELARLGLITPLDATGEWAVVNPSAVTASLLADEAALSRERERLAALQAEVSRFAPVYQQHSAARDEKGVLEEVGTCGAARAVLDEIIEDCRTEMLICLPGGPRPQAELAEAIPRELRLLARGVRLRSLYQHTVRFHAPMLAYANAVLEAGSLIRTQVVLPPRMIVVDRAVAIVPHTMYTAGAMLVREPSLVAFLHDVFDTVWTDATPLRDGARERHEVLHDTELKILRLLADGRTDRSVGSALGMSERTVRDRVRRLYEKLGAHSRFQAGMRAAALGLVDLERRVS